MKLNKEQIQKINHSLLKQDKVYDDMVRLELVDHIASVLEESESNFEESFKKYWLSKEKVLLITQAKNHIESKKNIIETHFWKQFINPTNLLLIIGLFFLLTYLIQNFDLLHTFINFSLLVLVALLLITFVIERFIKKRKYFYVKSLYGSISIFYTISLQLSISVLRDKIIYQTVYTHLFLFYISIIIISFWFFYKTYRFAQSFNNFQLIDNR